MSHIGQQIFCQKVKELYPNFFINKKVLDIGSLDINGSNRELFDNCEYIGLDIGEGKNVDVISFGHKYNAPDGYFDTIISTEAFEHDIYYDKTIQNITRMLKPGGLFVFTCASTNRPEHGTRRTNEMDAPFLSTISDEWGDYYKNLTEDDIKDINGFTENFIDGIFEINEYDTKTPIDLYFYGIKGGIKYYIDNITPKFNKDTFKDDIFIIDYWINTESKENDLVNLIKRLKIYNIPILLTGHHPIKVEIQRMVDYYLYDKNNPILTHNEYNSYNLTDGRWTDMGEYKIENKYEFHHDYAIWETMRNSFNFCKFLGKKNIHFLEYDNLPDEIQYRQSFLERINDFDVVLYEYHPESSKNNIASYCATFIFSIKTDIGLKVIEQINSKEEYFMNRPQGWNLEHLFLEYINKVTKNVHFTKYIANNNELNTQAVWDRDGVYRNGAKFSIYPAVDENDDLYIHYISGFHNSPINEDYLVEIDYCGFNKFHTIHTGGFVTEKIGKYHKGETIKIFHKGVEVYNRFLGNNIENFKHLNKLSRKITKISDDMKIDINFIDGPFIEIKEKNDNTYHVQFINLKTNNIEFELDLRSNHWAKSNKKYYVNWLIKIDGINNDYHSEYHFDLTNKRVLISFESKSIGDTLGWFPQVEKFRIEHNCDVICSTFHNYLFKEQYPKIKFVEPGSTVPNIYAQYRLGVFYNDGDVNIFCHPNDPKTEPLMKIASDILGLDYQEIKPILPILSTKKRKLVSIGIHSTAQCKYWNNPNGWQDVVDYLISKGYEVRLLSREEDGYMGNRNPIGVTYMETTNGKLGSIIKVLQQSELFIGVSSGLSWVSWGVGTETILISGFTDVYTEPMKGVRRIINKDVCNSCWNRIKFNAGDWNWCPEHQNTERHFECSKSITSEQVINEIKKSLNIID